MEYELPPKEKILEFLEKNCLTEKDLKEITGKGKSTINDWVNWLKGDESKSKFPYEIWLLLNALFNEKATFITETIRKYSKGDSFVNDPEKVRNFHEEIKLMEETVRIWNEMNSEERREMELEFRHNEHIEKAMKEYYHRHGTGPRVEKREAYTQIRNFEKALGLPKAIAIHQFEELSKEYKAKGMKGRNQGFIERILKIYDEYFENLEEANLNKYLENLSVAMGDWSESKSTSDIKSYVEMSDKEGNIRLRYFADTPEQATEIKETLLGNEKFDGFIKKSPDLEKKTSSSDSEDEVFATSQYIHKSTHHYDEQDDEDAQEIEMPLTITIQKKYFPLIRRMGTVKLPLMSLVHAVKEQSNPNPSSYMCTLNFTSK